MAMPVSHAGARWAAAVGGAALLGGVIAGSGALFKVKAIPKGWRAAYTMRAPSEIVWNQHEALVEDVRSFSPFYDEAPDLLESRRGPILAEVAQLQPAYWRSAVAEDELPDAGSLEGEADYVAQAVNLARAMFDVLEPYYLSGVVADAEFPAREQEVRVYELEAPSDDVAEAQQSATGGRYRRVRVSRLHRFSELRPLVEDELARAYPTIDPKLRGRLIGWVLDRLPPSLRYSRTNAEHIADRSLVTGQRAVLVRGGQVLVHRHQIVDTRAEDALRAAIDALPARRGAMLATLALLIVATLLGAQAMAATSARLARPWTLFAVLGGFAFVLAVGKVWLALSALSEMAVPMAAIAGVAAYRAGARSAAIVAILGAAYAALGLGFDATTFAVVLAGGVTLALVTRVGRPRSILVAGGAAALMQGCVFGACVLMGARPRSIDSVFAGLQAVGSGAVAGVLALGMAWLWRIAGRRPEAHEEPPLAAAESHATMSAQ
jgi:hypothetical protein